MRSLWRACSRAPATTSNGSAPSCAASAQRRLRTLQHLHPLTHQLCHPLHRRLRCPRLHRRPSPHGRPLPRQVTRHLLGPQTCPQQHPHGRLRTHQRPVRHGPPRCSRQHASDASQTEGLTATAGATVTHALTLEILPVEWVRQAHALAAPMPRCLWEGSVSMRTRACLKGKLCFGQCALPSSPVCVCVGVWVYGCVCDFTVFT